MSEHVEGGEVGSNAASSIPTDPKLLRRGRAVRSAKYVDRFRASMIELPLVDDGFEPTSSKVRDEIGAYPALNVRVAALRELAAPRTALPARIARSRWANLPLVRRVLLKLINYSAGPARRQATLVADCVDLLTHEVRIARGFERR